MAEEQPATKKDTVVFLTEEEASVPSKVQGSNPAAARLLLTVWLPRATGTRLMLHSFSDVGTVGVCKLLLAIKACGGHQFVILSLADQMHG